MDLGEVLSFVKANESEIEALAQQGVENLTDLVTLRDDDVRQVFTRAVPRNKVLNLISNLRAGSFPPCEQKELAVLTTSSSTVQPPTSSPEAVQHPTRPSSPSPSQHSSPKRPSTTRSAVGSRRLSFAPLAADDENKNDLEADPDYAAKPGPTPRGPNEQSRFPVNPIPCPTNADLNEAAAEGWLRATEAAISRMAGNTNMIYDYLAIATANTPAEDAFDDAPEGDPATAWRLILEDLQPDAEDTAETLKEERSLIFKEPSDSMKEYLKRMKRKNKQINRKMEHPEDEEEQVSILIGNILDDRYAGVLDAVIVADVPPSFEVIRKRLLRKERHLERLSKRQIRFNLRQDASHAFPGGAPGHHEQRGNYAIAISMERYIQNMVEQYEATNGGPLRKRRTPLPADFSCEDSSAVITTVSDRKMYHRMVGKLNWIASTLRADVAFAVSQVASKVKDPTERYAALVRHILGYLKKTAALTMVYSAKGSVVEDDTDGVQMMFEDVDGLEALGKDEDHGLFSTSKGDDGAGQHPVLEAYVDADLGGAAHRKSTTGLIILVSGNVVHWSSKRQTTTSTSTFESEIKGALTAALQVKYFRNLMRSFRFDVVAPTLVACDNLGVVSVLTASDNRLKAKHVGLAFYTVRELQLNGVVEYHHVRSDRNLSDILTKSLVASKHSSVVYRLFSKGFGYYKSVD
eukprot:scaffold3542_cov221-Pinguiococcus_pyrenoidosus.AAC.1